jgi:hypothetical protein
LRAIELAILGRAGANLLEAFAVPVALYAVLCAAGCKTSRQTTPSDGRVAPLRATSPSSVRKEPSLLSNGVRISLVNEAGQRKLMVQRVGTGEPVAFPAGYFMSSIESAGKRWSLAGREVGPDEYFDRDALHAWNMIYLWPGMAEAVTISPRCPSGTFRVAVAQGDVVIDGTSKGRYRIWMGEVTMKTPW